ncbi:MAG: hypothetical protein V4546_12020 [Bacteroidota bacterium]
MINKRKFDRLLIILSILTIALYFIWEPYVALLNTPEPSNYGETNYGTFQYLKYDAEIYRKYLRPGEYGGTPTKLDMEVQEAMLNEKIDFTIYLIGAYLIGFIFFRLKVLRQSKTPIEKHNIINKILLRYLQVNLGIQRLFLIGYAGWWIIFFIRNEVLNGFSFLCILIIYWIILSLVLWIYDGLRSQMVSNRNS